GTLLFGSDEHIECLVDIAAKGAKGEELCLAYKRTILFVGAGVKVSDNDYVLRPKQSNNEYYPMPPAAELKELQAAGLLPSPLPAYSLSAWDYIFGYSLWIVLVGTALFYAIKEQVVKARAAKAPKPATGSEG